MEPLFNWRERKARKNSRDVGDTRVIEAVSLLTKRGQEASGGYPEESILWQRQSTEQFD